MSTKTLRKLCDAMDALSDAYNDNDTLPVADTIGAAMDKIIFAMQDVVDGFETAGGEVDQESWCLGYEAALDDFDITEEDAAAHNRAFADDDAPPDLEVAIGELYLDDVIDTDTYNFLTGALPDNDQVIRRAYHLAAAGSLGRDELRELVRVWGALR